MENEFFSAIYLLYKRSWSHGSINRDSIRREYKAQINEKEIDTFATNYAKNYFAKRAPKKLNTVFDNVLKQEAWAKELQLATIILQWEDIVGKANAAKTKIIAIEDGIIHIQCFSTNWAIQMRSLRSKIISKIQEIFPAAEIMDISIKNPAAPSWNHGPLKVKGRGPRDTYG